MVLSDVENVVTSSVVPLLCWAECKLSGFEMVRSNLRQVSELCSELCLSTYILKLDKLAESVLLPPKIGGKSM